MLNHNYIGLNLAGAAAGNGGNGVPSGPRRPGMPSA